MTTNSERTGTDYIELGARVVTDMHEENSGTMDERAEAIAARFQAASRRRRDERVAHMAS
jgi:hypothetical protein